MFTRKDYVEIAEAIKVSLNVAGPPGYKGASAHAVARTARGVAEALKRNNPRFRFDIFYEACGLDEFGEVES